MTPIILAFLFYGQQITGAGRISGTGYIQASHSITLNWVASESPGVVGYRIYRSSAQGGPYTLYAFGIKGVQYTDTSVRSGETWYYVARAVDAQGNESVDSNEASGMVP
mgnify:FL=1